MCHVWPKGRGKNMHTVGGRNLRIYKLLDALLYVGVHVVVLDSLRMHACSHAVVLYIVAMQWCNELSAINVMIKIFHVRYSYKGMQ